MDERSPFDDLRQFLFEHVATYDELEVLLLLQRQPDSDWAAELIAKQLGLPTNACQTALENLTAHGLLVLRGNPPVFRYAPTSKALAVSVEQVQRAYRSAKVVIIQLMTTNAMARVRAGAMRKLGETLQLRDSKKDR